MKRYTLAFLSVASLAQLASASSLDVKATPGALSSLIESPETITELFVKGAVDARDLYFIGEHMPKLRHLDLNDATIEAYSGAKINGISAFPANEIPQSAFAASPLSSIGFPNTPNLAIGDFAFAGSGLTAVLLPANISKIGQGAFAACPALENVAIGCNATLKGYTFANNPVLAKAIIDSSVTAVAPADFEFCKSLRVVDRGESVTSIGSDAFKGCDALTSFPFSDGLRSVGDGAFAHTALTYVNLSRCLSLESVGQLAFAYNSALKEVTLPDNTSSVGRGAFFDCTALEKINIPEGCSAVSPYMLKGTKSLGMAVVPHGVSEIGEYAFTAASGLRQINLPSDLDYIGNHAMEGTTSLATLDATPLRYVPELGDDVWAGIDKSKVTLNVYEELVSEFKGAEQWNEFTINSISSNLQEGVVLPSEKSVRGRFDGTTLHIAATLDIESVELYDAAGLKLASATPGAETASIDTSAHSTDLYLVRCRLSDGTEATLKLAR